MRALPSPSAAARERWCGRGVARRHPEAKKFDAVEGGVRATARSAASRCRGTLAAALTGTNLRALHRVARAGVLAGDSSEVASSATIRDRRALNDDGRCRKANDVVFDPCDGGHSQMQLERVLSCVHTQQTDVLGRWEGYFKQAQSAWGGSEPVLVTNRHPFTSGGRPHELVAISGLPPPSPSQSKNHPGG